MVPGGMFPGGIYGPAGYGLEGRGTVHVNRLALQGINNCQMLQVPNPLIITKNCDFDC